MAYLFSGYVIVDTQMIVEKAENASETIYGTQRALYGFCCIVCSNLIILMRNAQNGRKRRDEEASSESLVFVYHVVKERGENIHIYSYIYNLYVYFFRKCLSCLIFLPLPRIHKNSKYT